MRRKLLRLAALCAAALVTTGGVAFATGSLDAIVGADGTITGCYQKQNGQLRVVNAASACNPSELAVTWSQRGPQGATGAQGPAGDDGADGVSVTTATLAVGDANCPTGGVAVAAVDGTRYVCNGERGPQGQQGEPGEDASADLCDLEQRIKAKLPTFVLSAECVPPPAEGSSCNDGDPSTYNDRIQNGVCVGLPIPNCDDGNPNTIDSFDPITGCANVPVGPETCNGIDDDHDGAVDEGLSRPVPNGSIQCQNGIETLFCNAGFASADGNRDNGCETNLMTDPNNCGAIGVVVSIPNATGSCVNGTAVLVSCNAGFFNANGSLVDGCELRADSFEPNDSQAAARSVPWGSLTANIAPAGNSDWFRYDASCGVFTPCIPRFALAGGGTLQVFEDGVFVGGGAVVTLPPRSLSHTYHVQVFAPGFLPSYQLNATER